MAASPMARRLTAVVEDEGLLLVQDRDLPSATTVCVGEPIAGSWWAHPSCHEIFDALQVAVEDAVRVKLVDGKVTLVHRRLWPELAAVGAGRSTWQVDGVPEEVLALARRAGRFRSPVEVKDLRPDLNSKGRKALVTEVERRLLLRVDSVHTDDGSHQTEVEGWRSWRRRMELPDPLPTPDRGRERFEAIVDSWSPGRNPSGAARRPRLPWR